MKRRYLFFLFSYMLVLLSSFNSNAQRIKPKQLLKKVDVSLSNIHTVIYKIDRMDNLFGSNDTLKRFAMGCLYINPKDKMKAYHILDMKYSKNSYAHYKYDGDYTASFSYNADSLNIPKKVLIENVAEINYSSITGSHIQNYLLKDYFKKQNIFRQYKSFLAKFVFKEMKVEETTHLDTPVYVLTVYGKDKPRSNRINSSIDKYYIRKSDFLPIAYSFYGEFQGMKQNEYFKIEYIEINPELSLDDFKIDTNITEIKPKSIYERLQKYNL